MLRTPQEMRLFLFFGFLTVMFLCESAVPVRAWHTPRWKRLAFHTGVSAVNTILTRFLAVAPLLVWIGIVRAHAWGLSRVFGLHGSAEVAATLIVFDGFDYWWHRLNHEIPFLWRFHLVHHMDTHVDVTTSLRFHPGELFLSYAAKAVWILIWGPSLLGFMIFEAGITAYSQFHHSNIDFPDRVEKWLRLIHMTPRLHTSHHTVSRRTRDANYATIFLIWDRLFGTLREPDREEMKQLGLPEGRLQDLSPVTFAAVPFIRKGAQ